jgi:hypothetical protein
VSGQLELQGYSAYLHPVGDGLLLGIGQDVGTSNEPSGSQLELFDVSKPSAPRLAAKTSLGSGSSTAAQYDHHAFLYWPRTGLAVLPVQIYSYQTIGPPVPASGGSAAGGVSKTAASSPASTGFTGAIGFHITATGITEVGRVSHDAVNGYIYPIDRELVVGKQLYTVAQDGVMASDLGTLARQSFAAFPQPQPAGCGPVPLGSAAAICVVPPLAAAAR